MITRNLRDYQAIFILITAAFCGSSALHILSTIEIKSLWADELKTFYKTVSLSTPQMMNYLRSDSHPPLYYLALRSWFSFFEPNTTTLRLASWINYVIGGILMTIQTFKLGKNETKSRAWVAACIGALITFSSPIVLRFSIEGKGYSLAVMLIAAGLLCRQNYITCNKKCQYKRLSLIGSFIFFACASLTHYYGLFITASIGVVDTIKAFALKNYSQKQRIKMVTSATPGSNIDIEGIQGLDKQIEVLLGCKPLPESEIRALCEKVSTPFFNNSQIRHSQYDC